MNGIYLLHPALEVTQPRLLKRSYILLRLFLSVYFLEVEYHSLDLVAIQTTLKISG